MSNIVRELEEQIDIDKEVIDGAPKTGVKQIRELRKTLEEMKERYEAINNAALDEMLMRYNRIDSIESNPEIAKVSEEIFSLDRLVLSESGHTSFEKMQLDRLTYNINGYYKKNLTIINKDIIECVLRFKEVGINLSGKDFTISEYANEYMTVLLEEYKNGGDINSERVKDTFENVYWKSSDLIAHVLVNIRQIYDLHEPAIDRFYKAKTEEVLRSMNVTQKQVLNKKDELIRKLDALKSVDGRIILDSFLDNTYSIGDYRKDTYEGLYEDFVSKKMDFLSEEEKADMDSNFKKLNNNLVEYFNFLDYKFLSDEILHLRLLRLKEIEKEKEDKKNKKTAYDLVKLEIAKVAGEIKKLNASLGQEKKGFFFKKSAPKNDTAIILERDNKVLELKDLYFKLDDAKLKDKIVKNIDETSKVLDVFKIASYYYGFLARAIIRKYPDIVEEDIFKMITKFRKFVRLYRFSVINNININEKKDIAVVIKDKYKLLGLTISKENFEEANLEDLMKKTQIIDYYNDIAKSNIPLEDIQYVMNAKPILKK